MRCRVVLPVSRAPGFGKFARALGGRPSHSPGACTAAADEFDRKEYSRVTGKPVVLHQMNQPPDVQYWSQSAPGWGCQPELAPLWRL